MIEFEILLSLSSGILFGPLSKGFIYTVLFVLLYEFFVLVYYIKNNNIHKFNIDDRVLINLYFFIGWTLSRLIVDKDI